MKWTVHPLIGVNEIKFGMSPDDVEKILGMRKSQIHRSSRYISYYYSGIGAPFLAFQDGRLFDVTFSRRTEAFYFDGLDYFQTPGNIFLDRVRQHDPEVMRDVLGVVTSFKLGMGFDDRVPLGDTDKTITLFSAEQIIDYAEFGPFTPA
jgi:hypothetical protein